MPSPTLIYDLDLPDLAATLEAWNEPSYRADQIWQGLYSHLWNSVDEFSNVPKPLRARLAETFSFKPLTPTHTQESSDSRTVKTLFELPDGERVEAVLMKYGDPTVENIGLDVTASPKLDRQKRKRRTLCISSQSGCAMGCVFCATGQMGFKRHLSGGEIVAQVMHYARALRAAGEKVTNIVLMGMGEPFHNYENTLAAIDRLNHPQGYAFGARRITVSTVGLVPLIRRFADEKRQVNLAISLHSVDDQERSRIMPVNKKYPLRELLHACRYYVDQTGRRITFEWALIQGVNDSEQVARQLARHLEGLLCHVNAIPLNPTRGFRGKAATRQNAAVFKETLERAGISCTVRMRRGIDIQAGCGQLAGFE